MKIYKIKDDHGVEGPLIRLDDGRYPCPICGDPWPYPAMMFEGDDIEEIKKDIRYTLGDVCDRCGIEFGVDIPYRFEVFRKTRIEKLNDWGWPQSALEMIEKNLGISEDDLRHDAEFFGLARH